MNKKTVSKILIFLVIVLLNFDVQAQVFKQDILTKSWNANWIKVSNSQPTDYGIYLFRKSFNLSILPKDFKIYISADNKYKLYINGKQIAMGPARSDLSHWNYDTIELSGYLKMGKNVLSAKVWNEGTLRPEAQVSLAAGLIIQGADDISNIVDTNNTWLGIQDHSYTPIPISIYSKDPKVLQVPGWYLAGPGENIDMKLKIKDWETITYNDDSWKNTEEIISGIPKNAVGVDVTSTIWRLTPSPIPQMDTSIQRFEKIRKVLNTEAKTGFLSGKSSIKVPANTTATILLDQNNLTNAFPTTIFSGGDRSEITLTYAESLYSKKQKGNRDDIDGKEILGRKDIIISDGSQNQNFTSLYYRTYRYVEIKVVTKDEPIQINDIYGTFYGFPLKMKAKIESRYNISEMDKIISIGWRTARLCATETYMDCPYWEQLQYIGDTRIQALLSLYNTGDDRLVKNAINQIDYSRKPEGLTSSRYPTINEQIIPTFSLWYIGMLQDYLKYGNDQKFIESKLSGARQILDYFANFTDKDGSLKNLPNWFFTDWAEGWERGMGPVGKDGSSAILDLQLLLAYQSATYLEDMAGNKDFASQYKMKANKLASTIRSKYWDNTKKIFSDTPEKDRFSQHTNSMAILANLVKGQEEIDLANQILNNHDFTEASIYFKFYVHQALAAAGLGNSYVEWLDIWRKNIQMGLTTWAEDSNIEGARSDCHAWGASPNIEFYRIILGIDSSSPNFKTVKIHPNLGNLKQINGEIPHPAGVLSVNYDLNSKKAIISLPKGITGEFIWNNKTYKLDEGNNKIDL